MFQDHASCYRAIAAKDKRFDGYIFTAVKTTGIYCRPICPARLPKSENVHFYPSAAAAQEAGFRPCLRCRPETAPETPAWRGTSATIGRALRLIDEGALDQGGVERLAMRLGLGDRQLRRLFLKHVGATPVGVAQARRINLAKQLLHETNLPMAQIALAAGFNSIRRFNEVFQSLFGRPPSDIRRSHVADRPGSSHDEMVLKLRFRAPYDWTSAAQFLRQRQYVGLERFEGADYCRTFCVNGKFGTLRIGPGGADWLKVGIRCDHLDILSLLIAKVRASFDLDCDPMVIGEHLGVDQKLAPLLNRHQGLRLLSSWSGFEGIVRTVLGQQVTLAAGIKLGNQLLEALGVPLAEDLAQSSGLKFVFPTPEIVARADLSFMRMPVSRQKTLKHVAQAFVDNDGLLEGSIDDVRARLLAIPGVGPWTVDYVALRVLRDTDAFPFADVALQRAYRHLGDGDLVSDSEAWRPWRAYGAQFLYQSLCEAQMPKLP
jgi:AraC family transcriptional regulator, regulatory protein of adaptative response / DNA-3-methyladenine glycosylase II